MRWPPSLIDLRREWRDAHSLLAAPAQQRRLVVYSEDTHSYQYLQGYLEQIVASHGRALSYVTSAPADPLLNGNRPGMFVYYVRQLLPGALSRLDCDVLATTMPDLGRFHVPRPKRSCWCVYIFHSLASVHRIYREGAFDHYDVFFCTGPHHRRELERYAALRGLRRPQLYDVGYYKLDRLLAAHAAHVRRTAKTTILLAPSWGEQNLLQAHGPEIVERLLSAGMRVIVRPHPCFFQPIYPAGRRVIDLLMRRYSDHPNVEIERGIDREDAFHEADLMISDFSGAAYEYAFATLRPVLFIDTPHKTRNARWQALGLPTFEDVMRAKVGTILSPDEVSGVARHAERLLATARGHADRLASLRAEAVYNLGHSARIGARVLDELLRERDGTRIGGVAGGGSATLPAADSSSA